MKNSLLKFLILFSFIFIIGCNSNDDDQDTLKAELPEITTEGAHTLGCKINGDIFLPKDDESCVSFECLPVSELRLSYLQNGSQYQLSIIARNNINGNISLNLDLYLNEPLQEQVYDLSEAYIPSINRTWPNGSSCIYQRIDGENFNSCFATNSDVTGTLEITAINEEERFISGTFEFQAVNQSGNVVNFTDGRFDILVYYTNVF